MHKGRVGKHNYREVSPSTFRPSASVKSRFALRLLETLVVKSLYLITVVGNWDVIMTTLLRDKLPTKWNCVFLCKFLSGIAPCQFSDRGKDLV